MASYHEEMGAFSKVSHVPSCHLHRLKDKQGSDNFILPSTTTRAQTLYSNIVKPTTSFPMTMRRGLDEIVQT